MEVFLNLNIRHEFDAYPLDSLSLHSTSSILRPCASISQISFGVAAELGFMITNVSFPSRFDDSMELLLFLSSSAASTGFLSMTIATMIQSTTVSLLSSMLQMLPVPLPDGSGTLNLKAEEEKENRRQMIRSHAQVMRASLLFRLAGEWELDQIDAPNYASIH